MKNSEPLVLVPGLMCDETVWEHQIESFAPDRDVIVAEHGMADSLGEMAERILGRLDGAFALAGHSMGGRVAFEVLARAPGRVNQ